MANNEVIDINEERLAFYYELGLAITQWAHVEFALAGIVAICFRPGRTQLAVDGFISIENFRAKLQYVDMILSQRELADEEKENWAALRDRCANLAKKRNKLAHHWILTVLDGKPGRRIKLLPKRSQENDTRQKYPGAICLRDIDVYRLEFSALTCSLENFCDRLVPQEEHFPKSREQPMAPQTLAQLRRAIYEHASRPPRPSLA